MTRGHGRVWLWMPVLLGLGMAACSPTASLRELPASTTSGYALDSGDEVRVNAYGLDGFSSTYVVGDNGAISLPLIGDVMARGQTADQLQQMIADQLTSKAIVNKPIVNVQVNHYRPFYVIGEVNKPGEYAFRPGTSVLTAISMAGGYTFRAKRSQVAITRRMGNQGITAAANEQASIQPGDTIRVFESWF